MRMAIVKYITGASLAILLLSGCDPIYGVATMAELHQPPDIRCVDETLRTTAGIETVEHGRNQSSALELLPHYGEVTTTTDYWIYGGGAILQINQNSQRIGYENGLLRLNHKVPEAQLNAYVPLMNLVNTRLETNCAIPLSSDGRIYHN